MMTVMVTMMMTMHDRHLRVNIGAGVVQGWWRLQLELQTWLMVIIMMMIMMIMIMIMMTIISYDQQGGGGFNLNDKLDFLSHYVGFFLQFQQKGGFEKCIRSEPLLKISIWFFSCLSWFFPQTDVQLENFPAINLHFCTQHNVELKNCRFRSYRDPKDDDHLSVKICAIFSQTNDIFCTQQNSDFEEIYI